MFTDRQILEFFTDPTTAVYFSFNKETEEAPYSLYDFAILRELTLKGESDILLDKDITVHTYPVTEKGAKAGFTIKYGQIVDPEGVIR